MLKSGYLVKLDNGEEFVIVEVNTKFRAAETAAGIMRRDYPEAKEILEIKLVEVY